MRRIISIVTLYIAALLCTSIFVAFGQSTPDNTIIPAPQSIFTQNNNQGIINNETLFVFGPNICTSYGDPYSPGTSPYTTQHPHTYNFSIVIPPDYSDDVLRVELFDPDSFNQFAVEDEVSYSDTAIANGFPSPPQMQPCSREYQMDACIINTTEYMLTETIPGIKMNQVNPIWLVRVDENRGNGTFACTRPITYSPQYNTATLYALSYDKQHIDGLIESVQLASYTGQVYDDQRDSGDHLTDLRWVSPGGTPSSDQPAFVPTDPGSETTFELNIEGDLPNIVVDPVTGDRIVHLHVTSLSGGSKNSFAVWAGPNDDVAVVPGEVNARNLFQINNPSAAYNQGVQILADETFLLQSMFHEIDIPLMYLGPEYAGQTTRISIFDLDSTSVPPINFYFDTLAYKADDSQNGFDETQTDWVVAHGFPGDPEGGCFTNPYDTQPCNDKFVSYNITLPSDLDCSDTSPDSCIPFYGGYLRANFPSDSPVDAYDGSAWEIDEPNPVTDWDNTQGCSAFPIAVDENIRSVVPPGQTGANRWRTDFDYPFPAPDYYQFINHTPNTPLLGAKPGDLFNLQNGESSGGKGWLAWNQCISQNASTLEDSLTWPGNSKDYNPTGGTCSLNGETMERFPGFMEVGDNSDKNMNIGDWVAVNNGNVNSNGIRDAVEEHVKLGRTLRVIVYQDVEFNAPAYRISRFALMRLIGYSLDSSGGESFIMAEFMGWDDSCGQVPLPQSAGGNGPGGVGDTDGSTNLALWLQADEEALTDVACTPGTEAGNNETVACWLDQSGKDNHATETTNGPAMLTAVSNNQPALQFNGSNYLDNALDLNGRSGFTFFEVAGAATEANYQSILRFQDAADSSIVYPDGNNQLTLNNGTSANAGFVPDELNIGTAVYQLNTSNGMRTFHDGILVASADTGSTPLPTDSLTIGRNNATQSDYANAGVSELIVFDRELSTVERILVENYLSAKYAQPIANDKFNGDDPDNDDFDMDVAGIGREADSLHTNAASSGMIVVNNTFLRDPGDYLLFGHRTTTNDNTQENLPTVGDWDGAPDPQRWTRYWYINVTDEGSNMGGGIKIIFDLSDAGMQGLPNGPASNYRLLKRAGINDVFTDIATAVSIEGDRIIFDGVDVALLGSNFTLGTLDAGTSPTAIMLETAVVQSTAPTLLIILMLIAFLSLPTYLVMRRQTKK